MLNFQTLKSLVLEAGRMLCDAQVHRDDIMAKSGHQNFVTLYDEKVQHFLEQAFDREWPDYGFYGEENDRQRANPATDQVFIVDPIDGTSNFIHQIPFSAVCVAVARKGQVEQAIVYNPFLEELYEAQRGQCAFLNGEKLQVPDLNLADGLFAVGMSPYNATLVKQTLDSIQRLMPEVTDIRRLGSAALDICHVASGRQVGFLEWELQPWDYAAASLIAEEAGVRISDPYGHKLQLGQPSGVLVAGPRAYEQSLKILNP